MATILVIEDNAANMKLAVFLLQNAGYSVLSAPDAEAGLTLARKERPDLILMDIQLPGMDGLAATALLKRDEATHAIPVVALTALAMKGSTGSRGETTSFHGSVSTPSETARTGRRERATPERAAPVAAPRPRRAASKEAGGPLWLAGAERGPFLDSAGTDRAVWPSPWCPARRRTGENDASSAHGRQRPPLRETRPRYWPPGSTGRVGVIAKESRLCAVRRARSTKTGVSPRAKMKPR